MIFVRETRGKICKKYPDMHALQVMKEVGKTWQNLNGKEKQRYEDLAELDKERFLSDIKKFEQEICAMSKLGENSNQSSTEIKEGVKPSKVADTPKEVKKDPKKTKASMVAGVKRQKKITETVTNELKMNKSNNKPKRPLSAYIFFSQRVSFARFIF